MTHTSILAQSEQRKHYSLLQVSVLETAMRRDGICLGGREEGWQAKEEPHGGPSSHCWGMDCRKRDRSCQERGGPKSE